MLHFYSQVIISRSGIDIPGRWQLRLPTSWCGLPKQVLAPASPNSASKWRQCYGKCVVLSPVLIQEGTVVLTSPGARGEWMLTHTTGRWNQPPLYVLSSFFLFSKWTHIPAGDRFAAVRLTGACDLSAKFCKCALHCIALHCIALHCIALSSSGNARTFLATRLGFLGTSPSAFTCRWLSKVLETDIWPGEGEKVT